MKNEVIKKEIKHICIGVAVFDAIMLLVFFLIKKLDLSAVLGCIVGTVFAIGNFIYLGYSVEKAVEKGEQGKAYLRKTYTVRVILHMVCICLGALLDQLNVWATVIPLFLPRLTIFAMQILGMYKPEAEKQEEQQ